MVSQWLTTVSRWSAVPRAGPSSDDLVGASDKCHRDRQAKKTRAAFRSITSSNLATSSIGVSCSTSCRSCGMGASRSTTWAEGVERRDVAEGVEVASMIERRWTSSMAADNRASGVWPLR